MNIAVELPPAEENAVARKNLLVYLFCQSISAAAIPMNIALGGLAGGEGLLGHCGALGGGGGQAGEGEQPGGQGERYLP